MLLLERASSSGASTCLPTRSGKLPPSCCAVLSLIYIYMNEISASEISRLIHVGETLRSLEERHFRRTKSDYSKSLKNVVLHSDC